MLATNSKMAGRIKCKTPTTIDEHQISFTFNNALSPLALLAA